MIVLQASCVQEASVIDGRLRTVQRPGFARHERA